MENPSGVSQSPDSMIVVFHWPDQSKDLNWDTQHPDVIRAMSRLVHGDGLFSMWLENRINELAVARGEPLANEYEIIESYDGNFPDGTNDTIFRAIAHLDDPDKHVITMRLRDLYRINEVQAEREANQLRQAITDALQASEDATEQAELLLLQQLRKKYPLAE